MNQPNMDLTIISEDAADYQDKVEFNISKEGDDEEDNYVYDVITPDCRPVKWRVDINTFRMPSSNFFSEIKYCIRQF